LPLQRVFRNSAQTVAMEINASKKTKIMVFGRHEVVL
jgi:hypothetical protein